MILFVFSTEILHSKRMMRDYTSGLFIILKQVFIVAIFYIVLPVVVVVVVFVIRGA